MRNPKRMYYFGTEVKPLKKMTVSELKKRLRNLEKYKFEEGRETDLLSDEVMDVIDELESRKRRNPGERWHKEQEEDYRRLRDKVIKEKPPYWEEDREFFRGMRYAHRQSAEESRRKGMRNPRLRCPKGMNPVGRDGRGTRAKFCIETIKHKRYFDPRSFRTKRFRAHRITFGCPEGQWSPKRGECKVPMQVHHILHPAGEPICPVPGEKIKSNPLMETALAYALGHTIGDVGKYAIRAAKIIPTKIKGALLNPERPPKKWFQRIVRSLAEDPRITDPKAVAGWLWHYGMLPETKREVMRTMENPSREDIQAHAVRLFDRGWGVDSVASELKKRFRLTAEMAKYLARRASRIVRGTVKHIAAKVKRARRFAVPNPQSAISIIKRIEAALNTAEEALEGERYQAAMEMLRIAQGRFSSLREEEMPIPLLKRYEKLFALTRAKHPLQKNWKRPKGTSFKSAYDDAADLAELGYDATQIKHIIKKKWRLTDKGVARIIAQVKQRTGIFLPTRLSERRRKFKRGKAVRSTRIVRGRKKRIITGYRERRGVVKWYVGAKKKDKKLVVFNSIVKPTQRRHGRLYLYAVGPFKTKEAAEKYAYQERG